MKLPKRSLSHHQETRCFRRLEELLPEDLFIIRQQDEVDYGTDRILECLDQGSATNVCIHLQGKDIDKPKLLLDGTLSYPVPIKTLNYLLNHPKSIFVIHPGDTGRILWEWAETIAEKVKGGPAAIENTEQKTIHHRFSKPLDQPAWRDIHTTALRQARISRQILSQESSNCVLVDLQAGQVSTPQQMIDELLTTALAEVNLGITARAEELVNRIPPNQLNRDPRARLAAAFTFAVKGAVYRARTLLPTTDRALEALDANEQDLATFLNHSLDLMIGRIDHESFVEIMRNLSRAGLSRSQNELTRISLEAPKILDISLNEDEARRLAARLESDIDEIQSQGQKDGLDSELLQAQAAASRLEIQCVQFLRQSLQAVFFSLANRAAGTAAPPLDHGRFANMISQSLQRLHETAQEVEGLARRTGSERILAQAAVAKHRVLSTQIIITKLSSQDSNDEIRRLTREAAALITKDAEALASKGLHFHEATLKLMAAEILDGVSDEDATAIAKEVEQIGLQTGNPLVSTPAATFLEKGGLTRKVKQGPPLGSFANLSSEEKQRFLNFASEVLGIPEHQRGPLVRSIERSQEIERIKTEFCRHFNVLESLRHRQSHRTSYATDPGLRGHCELKDLLSQISTKDTRAAIESFKRIYCRSCGDRSPRSNPSS